MEVEMVSSVLMSRLELGVGGLCRRRLSRKLLVLLSCYIG